MSTVKIKKLSIACIWQSSLRILPQLDKCAFKKFFRLMTVKFRFSGLYPV